MTKEKDIRVGDTVTNHFMLPESKHVVTAIKVDPTNLDSRLFRVKPPLSQRHTEETWVSYGFFKEPIQ